MRVDLNCDLGESFGAYVIGGDEEVLPHVTSVNIACGYHAGDHNVMGETVKLAKSHGVNIGAHPGYNDLMGFGRRHIDTTPEDIYHTVLYQIGALHSFCKAYGVKMHHVKPHGALFNKASVDFATAAAIAEAVRDADPTLLLFGLSGSQLINAGEKAGLAVVQEVFADRSYQPDGTLTPRSHKEAVLTDPSEVVERAVRMVKEGRVRAVDGSEIILQADTVCIHGDGKNAAVFAKELKKELEQAGVEIIAAGAVRR